MKRCPYCAEEIQDAAIKCRYCRSLLPLSAGPSRPAVSVLSPPHGLAPTPQPGVPAVPAAPSTPGGAAPSVVRRATERGSRYLLGLGDGYYGIWDGAVPGPPVERFPETAEGWERARASFGVREPASVPVGVPPHEANTAWYLLPLLTGALGGVIAWRRTRRADPEGARSLLATGIVTSVPLAGLLLFTLSRVG